MKNAKLYAILIASAFAIALVFSFILLFSISKVQIEYGVYGIRDNAVVTEELEKFKGKNILFVSESEVKDAVKSHTHFNVVSIEKDYPNVLKVNVLERKEVYCFNMNERWYSLDQTGFIISISETPVNQGREIIDLQFIGIDILSQNAGEALRTSNDTLFNSILAMAKSVNLTDCIKSIKIESGSVESGVKEAVFKTYTGVDITIPKADERGEEKVKAGFAAYDNADDYRKSNSSLSVILEDSGEIKVHWKSPDGQSD